MKKKIFSSYGLANKFYFVKDENDKGYRYVIAWLSDRHGIEL